MPRKTISEADKKKAMEAMLAPNAPSVNAIARQFRISPPTLYKWRREAGMEAAVEKPASGWGDSDEVGRLRARVVELEKELAKRNSQLLDLLLASRGMK